MTVDHIVPRSKGGTDHEGNLQIFAGRATRPQIIGVSVFVMPVVLPHVRESELTV